ncbi:hypothetical protein [Chryseobacterium sp. JK1]|uniref:hypothetical protein n=1 Tax=Chryseobacterium sp. JK1 TaxID=874294 RepID=UPI003D6882EB
MRIGRKLAAKMKANGVYRARDILWVRKMMRIHGVRVIDELKRVRQPELNKPPPKKSIAEDRNVLKKKRFGTLDFHTISSCISQYAEFQN